MPDAEWSEIIHRSNKLAAGPNAQDAAERWNSVAIWRFSSGGTLNSNHERPVRGVTEVSQTRALINPRRPSRFAGRIEPGKYRTLKTVNADLKGFSDSNKKYPSRSVHHGTDLNAVSKSSGEDS